MDWLNTITPALSDVPLTILAVAVVGVIVYRVLASNSKASDQLYRLFERTIVSNEKLGDAIASLERTNREIADAERTRQDEERKQVINALRETEARIISALNTRVEHDGD